MTYESSLAVAQIIARHEPQHIEVLSCRHEVIWPGGTLLGLHPVRQRGADAQLLRGVHHAGNWIVFDLSRFLPRHTVEELCAAPLRDHPGTVMYALRARFNSAMSCLLAAHDQPLAHWPGVNRAATSRPGRRPQPSIA